MKTPIATKSLGLDDDTGLEKVIEVFKININSDEEVVNVEYRINYLAPKNSSVVKTEYSGYTRYNRLAVLRIPGEVISQAEFDEKGNVIKEPVFAKGDEIRTEAKLKFNELRDSQVGKMITGLINLDFNEYPNLAQE